MIGVCYGAAALLHLVKDQFFRLDIDEVHVVETAPPQQRCCLSRTLTTLELAVGRLGGIVAFRRLRVIDDTASLAFVGSR